MEEKIGEVIGNYRIIAQLGQGAFSEIYLAQHIVLTNRTVAIKFLLPVFGRVQQEQFVKEAHVLEQLKHPYILPIYDVGFHDNRVYLIIEYASGGSLHDHIKRLAPGRIPTEQAFKILLQISQALEYAHQQNVVHLDVKPGNILFDGSGDALLADFGIAIMLDPEKSEANLDTAGTPAYMAPERLAGDVSGASDQYALGCIAYELLTGRKPFIADNVLEVLRKQKQEIPTPLRQLVPEISPAIEQVVLTSLAKDRRQRFASVAEFAGALERATKGPRTSLLLSTFRFATGKLGTKSPISTVLFQSSIGSYEELKDFFVTYHHADRFWAEWIAWQLEDAGYTTILPAWDFRAGTNFNVEIRKASAKAKHIIAVLSPDYFAIRKNLEEWNTTFRQNTVSGYERLIPVLVCKCEQKQMKFLKSIVYIDLVECDEATACQLLLAEVRRERIKPSFPPPFPGKQHKAAREDYPPFPASEGTSDQLQFTRQVVPLIRAAFAKKDWSDVLHKTAPLLNPEAAHTLSSELYHLHAQALFEVGEVQEASAALETALTLEHNEEKRLVLLQDYTNILTVLGRWNEVLSYADIALQQVPDAPNWLAFRQEALSQMNAATVLRPRSQIIIPAPQGVEVFFSYSHKDGVLRNELEKYLSGLKRQHAIVGWYDGEIGAGREWDREIEEHINSAHIILLLVSQDFIASDYCYEKEMKRALERHDAGEARVVPIILRPAHWDVMPFGKLQALPTGAKPVTLWPDRDEAFLDVARGIQKIVGKLTKPKA